MLTAKLFYVNGVNKRYRSVEGNARNHSGHHFGQVIIIPKNVITTYYILITLIAIYTLHPNHNNKNKYHLI